MKVYFMESLADMSIDDLRTLVAQMIDERLGSDSYRTGRASPEVWRAIVDNVVQPQQGAPSPSELLLKEREAWANAT
jgi:hypothetical protein